MHQNGRILLHLINLSGQSQTAYFPPIPMAGIRIDVAGTYRRARAVRASQNLDVRTKGGYSEFTVPQLSDYELVVIE